MRFPELQRRIALVTGGGRGIGRAIVESLLAEGSTVVSADLGHPDPELARVGEREWRIHLDVSSESGIVQTIDRIADSIGTVDLLVTAAGTSTMDLTIDSETRDWELNHAVNARGTYLAAKHVARRLVAANADGRLIFIASQAGKNGYRAMSSYVASKHAVLGLTKTMAVELARDGITVNAVCPGIIETDMKRRERVEGAAIRGLSPEDIEREDQSQVPLGRTGQPEDVANVVLFLASDLSAYMTGQSLNVTGGMTMH